MTSSRSSILRSSLVVLAALVFWMGHADAGRKRIVVLEFDGPKADRFHADVVKLIKKKHTVLKLDRWNAKAQALDATAVTDKNIKKIASKLKIDGVITGRIEKRRDEYIIRIKVRTGADGSVGSSVQTKSESARLDARAKRDLADELLPGIESLESVRGGGGDDDEEVEEETSRDDEADEEDEEEPRRSGFGKKGQMREDPKELARKKKAEEAEAKRLAKEEEARRKKDEEKRKKEEAAEAKKRKKKEAEEAAFARKNKDDEEDEEDEELTSDSEDEEDEGDRRRRKKRTASADEDEEGIEEEFEADVPRSGRNLSPSDRAVDAVVGMSFTARRLTFSYASDLAKPPPDYKQPLPVAGALLDVTVYPLALGKTKGLLRGLGLNLMYDQVLLINSRKRYSDEQGMQRIATLDTKENRWAVGPVFRYPMGKVVLGGSLTYGRQQFKVAQTLPNNESSDIPNVHYTMVTPAVFVKYPVTPKINLNADAAFHAISNTGQIQQTGMAGYGAATVTGFELEGGGDYMLTKNIFARASVRYQSIGFKFKGDPTSQTNVRDTDPEQDVMGAKDVYFGGSVTVGYVY